MVLRKTKAWWKQTWRYLLAALICGTVVPLIGLRQSNNLNLLLLVLCFIWPLCIVSIGCIFSVNQKRFDWILPLAIWICSAVVMNLCAYQAGFTQKLSYVAVTLIASIPAAFFAVVELFFLAVRKCTSSSIGWGYYLAVYILCAPFAQLLVVANKRFFPWLFLALFLACAAIVFVLFLRRQRIHFALTAWALLSGVQIALLQRQSILAGNWTKPLAVILLPTAAVFAASVIFRTIQTRRMAQGKENKM